MIFLSGLLFFEGTTSYPYALSAYGQKLIFASEEGGFADRRLMPLPAIVLQQTTQSFLATHNSVLPARPSIRQGEQEPVLLALP